MYQVRPLSLGLSSVGLAKKCTSAGEKKTTLWALQVGCVSAGVSVGSVGVNIPVDTTQHSSFLYIALGSL